LKILALSFSPRKNGNTEILLGEVLKGAQQEGAQTELIRVSDNEIRPCDGCRACWDTGECHIKDDMQNLYPKLLEADGIIFGTPVYFYSMAGQAKTFIDRTCALGLPGRNLANKVGGIVVVAGSLGLVDTLKDLYFYFVTRQMLPANNVAAYAGNKGEVANLPKCMTAAKDLGRQMALIAAKKFEYPVDIKRSGIAYGTHTH
jgi:multimeric flavodoxin WrbA